MGFKGNALNLSCLLSGELCSPLKFLLLSTLVNKGGQSPPFKSKECWASPKSVSLSAESDQRLCLWKLQAFEKACAKLLIVLIEVIVGANCVRPFR